jgi:hypothetical protein
MQIPQLPCSRSVIRVTLRPAVYRQSGHLGTKPLEDHDQSFFCNYTHTVVGQGLWREGGFCLLRICLAFVKCTYCTYRMILKIIPCAPYTSPVSPGFAKQIMPVLFILCYNGSLVTWTVVSLIAAKFKPHFFVPNFALSYAANMASLMILHELCLLPTRFCCIIVYIRKFESRVHLGKFPIVRRTLFFSCCNFKR